MTTVWPCVVVADIDLILAKSCETNSFTFSSNSALMLILLSLAEPVIPVTTGCDGKKSFQVVQCVQCHLFISLHSL